mmetsp:Transcript_8578/g.25833  ORF Transcript_8578/g.25833 Transcript_8578/m.25833 type:complete len:234 (+) Transcript_8578:719-1420(+)
MLCGQLLLLGKVRIYPHGQVVERNAELLADVPQVVVVADDDRNFAIELLAILPEQNVVKAVIELGDQDGHPLGLVAQAQRPLHVETVRDGLDGSLETRDGGLRAAEIAFTVVKVDALEEEAGVGAGVLVRLDDIASLAVKHGRRGRDHPLCVRAVHQKRGLPGLPSCREVGLPVLPLPPAASAVAAGGRVLGRDVRRVGAFAARVPPHTPPRAGQLTLRGRRPHHIHPPSPRL